MPAWIEIVVTLFVGFGLLCIGILALVLARAIWKDPNR